MKKSKFIFGAILMITSFALMSFTYDKTSSFETTSVKNSKWTKTFNKQSIVKARYWQIIPCIAPNGEIGFKCAYVNPGSGPICKGNTIVPVCITKH